MLLSQISGMALLIWESNDIAEDKSSSSYPKIRWPLDLICPSMFILLKMNQWCQRSMLFSDGKFSESISSGPTISSTPRRSFLQDNVYMEQGYREASGGSFCMYETKITVWKQKQRTKQPLIYIHRKSFLCFVISQAHDIKNKKMKKNIVLI